ncbi:MAG TPA: DUF2231 domain-containing protein, partial [Candidatus Saccharimonadales bacterium]|nr:DUF2231 domain-containing protein [Candidatus Saccharimonadales bacterium]
MPMHPLDFRTILLEKHAQHVVLIHFPIALFLSGVGIDFWAQWMKRQELRAVARINFLLAAIATVPTVITGLIAWQWALEGKHLKGVLLLHLVLGLLSAMIIWWVWAIHFRARAGKKNELPR